MRKQQRFIVSMLLSMLLCVVWPSFAYAEVTTTTEGAGGSEAVYIAGNPHAYPVEYYNEDTKQYEGIMPSLWETVSRETGLDFVYIKAGPRDLRAQLAKNRQVEIVSACTGNEPWLKETEAEPGRTFLTLKDEQGKDLKLYLAYTDIADPSMVKAIEGAVKAASDSELTTIAVNFMTSHPVEMPSIWLVIWPILFVCVAVALAVVTTRYRRYRKDVEEKGQIDFRTGIYNKAYFLDFYKRAISSQYRTLYAIIYIGFDVAHVNENYSEETVENQLCFAADELKLSVREQEVVARVSASGFGIVRFSGSEKDAADWTEKVLARLNTFHQNDARASQDPRAMFYGGIYMLEPSDHDCEKALFKAQKGYIEAVNEGVPCVITRQEQLVREAKEQVLKRELVEGIRSNQFKMVLQFGVYAKDGKISGAEAFSRWEHPSRGLLHPGSYIPLLEAQGSIPELDFFIFEEVCRTLEKWTKQGWKMILSCNFARMSIEQPDFVTRLEKIAARYHFERRHLILEISESAMDRNHAQTFENITRCKALGFSVALDDVGSGVSDFADFRYEAVTLVKLDRALLNAAVTPRGEALLRGLIGMFHGMGLHVLCEGVETESQWRLLQRLGVDYIQGYYFYHPLPVEEAERVLEAPLSF